MVMSPINLFLVLSFISAKITGKTPWAKTIHGLVTIGSLTGVIFLTAGLDLLGHPLELTACLFGVVLCASDLISKKSKMNKGRLTFCSFFPFLLFYTNNLLIFCFLLLAYEANLFLDQLNLKERGLIRADRLKFDLLLRVLTIGGIIAVGSSLLSSARLEDAGLVEGGLGPMLPTLFILLALQYLGIFTSRRTNDSLRLGSGQDLTSFIQRAFVPSGCVFFAFQITEKLSFSSFKLALLIISAVLFIGVLFCALANARDKDNNQSNFFVYFSLISAIFFFSQKFGPLYFLTWTIALQGVLVLYALIPSSQKYKKILGSLLLPSPISIPYWALVWEAFTYSGPYRSVLIIFVCGHFIVSMATFKIGNSKNLERKSRNKGSPWPTAILTVFVLALFIVKMVI